MLIAVRSRSATAYRVFLIVFVLVLILSVIPVIHCNVFAQPNEECVGGKGIKSENIYDYNNVLTPKAVYTFTFSLKTGWNLITLPLYNTSLTIAEQLADAIPCECVKRYNSSSQNWEMHERNTTDNNFQLENGTGYLVYLATGKDFAIEGKELSGVEINLKKGWNSIGWYENNTTYPEEIMSGITNSTSVAYWDAMLSRFVVHPKGTETNNFSICKSMGLLVYTETNSIWDTLPTIISVEHDAATVLGPSEEFNVTLSGDNGYTASFDIGAVIIGIAMTEGSPGVYKGSYTIATGDPSGTYNIIGHLWSERYIDTMNALTTVTIDTAAPGGITNLAATPSTTTGTNVTLTWTASGDDGNTGTASNYDVRYSTSIIDTNVKFNSATQCSGEPAPKVADSSETFTVTGLTEGTTYYFAIKTADEVPNWSPLSNSPNAKPSVAPAAVTNLATSSPTQNSITLTWMAPGNDGNSGTASTYDIRYYSSAITDSNWASATQCTGEPAPKAAGSSESFTVTSLSASTTYYFAIKTADAVPNWSSISNSPSGTTSAAPDTILPNVTSTTPANSATGVAVTTTIVVQFSEAMNKANTEGAFSTSPATTGTFTWNAAGDKMTYTPSTSLSYSTTYTVSITNSATDLAGNKLDGNGNGVVDNPASKDTYKFSFTTEAESDTTGPTVSGVAVSPATVTIGQTSTLTANVDDSTTGNSNIASAEWSKGASAASPGSGTAMSASDGTFNSPTEGVTATIDTTGWTAGTYTIWVRGKDASNNWGNAVSTTLTVNAADTTLPQVTSTTPANGATSVAVTTTIAVQFSEAMNKTNTQSAFSTNPATTGTFTWNVAGDKMTYTPSASLSGGTTYTVTITPSAKDLAGNPLDGDGDGVQDNPASKDNYVFSFTTAGGGTVNKYAVVIGIDLYQNFNDLQYCDDDAADWKALLQSEGYTIHYLTNSQATEANVKSEVQWLASTATANDYVVFTFSGHGVNAGDVGLSGTWQGIACTDAAAYTEVGIYRDSEMASDLSTLASTHVFIYFDSCRSGGMSEVEVTGRLVQMGCAANGYTYDGDSTMKNGVWTWHTIYYYGQGYTCMEDNFAVAAPAASNWVKTNYPGNTMSPVQSDKYTGSFYF